MADDTQIIQVPIFVRLNHKSSKIMQQQIMLSIAGQQEAKFQAQGGNVVMLRCSTNKHVSNIYFQDLAHYTPQDTLALIYTTIVGKDEYFTLNIQGTLFHLWGLKPNSVELVAPEIYPLDWSKPEIYTQKDELIVEPDLKIIKLPKSKREKELITQDPVKPPENVTADLDENDIIPEVPNTKM